MRTIAVMLAVVAVGCGSPDSEEPTDPDGAGGEESEESGGSVGSGGERDDESGGSGSGGESVEPSSGGASTGGATSSSGGDESGSGGDEQEGSGGDVASGGVHQGTGGTEGTGGMAAMCDDSACKATAFQSGVYYCGGDPEEPECLSCAPGWCNCSQSPNWEPGGPNGEACETRKEPSYDTCSTICSLP